MTIIKELRSHEWLHTRNFSTERVHDRFMKGQPDAAHISLSGWLFSGRVPPDRRFPINPCRTKAGRISARDKAMAPPDHRLASNYIAMNDGAPPNGGGGLVCPV